jgi:hypothetical protein
MQEAGEGRQALQEEEKEEEKEEKLLIIIPGLSAPAPSDDGAAPLRDRFMR